MSTSLILDLGLPRKSGLEVLGSIRRFSGVPVIILSGRQEIEVKTTCLDLGADDYITKPFANTELVARCRTALRHVSNTSVPSIIMVGDLQIETNSRQVTVAGREVRLTRLEYDILKELVMNRGRVVEYEYLWAKVWRYDHYLDRDAIHQLLSRLRSKIEDQGHPEYVTSIPGIGYLVRDFR